MSSSEDGMTIRREVLGDEYVERVMAHVTPLDSQFQEWITNAVWGEIWTRPGLDRRTRSLVTIAILAALDREELDLHLEAAENCGVTPSEIVEVMFHVGAYAGVPLANSGVKRIKSVAEQRP